MRTRHRQTCSRQLPATCRECRRLRLPVAGAVLLGLLLAGCASSPPRPGSSVSVPVNAQSGCHAPPPNLQAAYNRPYTVKGRTYTPLHSAQGYDEVGTASWYGWESGSTTSMGVRFNPREFTAASRVLPLPTCVQVTNLDNGLSALVLVNDRGPFVSDRLLDLSMGAAQALGVTRTGTAPVRIVALPDGANAPLQLAAAPAAPAAEAQAMPAATATPMPQEFAPQQFAPQPVSPAPQAEVAVVSAAAQAAPQQQPVGMQIEPLPPLQPAAVSAAAAPAPVDASPLPPPAAAASVPPSADGGVTQTYVQTGAFTLLANAEAERERMRAAGIGNVGIVPGYIRGQLFYRVQIGPLPSAPDSALTQKLQGLGLTHYSVVQQ
jgi:rare lipoprotein A